jgi:hypothetical protein
LRTSALLACLTLARLSGSLDTTCRAARPAPTTTSWHRSSSMTCVVVQRSTRHSTLRDEREGQLQPAVKSLGVQTSCRGSVAPLSRQDKLTLRFREADRCLVRTLCFGNAVGGAARGCKGMEGQETVPSFPPSCLRPWRHRVKTFQRGPLASTDASLGAFTWLGRSMVQHQIKYEQSIAALLHGFEGSCVAVDRMLESGCLLVSPAILPACSTPA